MPFTFFTGIPGLGEEGSKRLPGKKRPHGNRITPAEGDIDLSGFDKLRRWSGGNERTGGRIRAGDGTACDGLQPSTTNPHVAHS